MNCPGFTVVRYGVYDSRVSYSKGKPSTDRLVASYEIEYYSQDQVGMTCLNGQWHTLTKGSFLCAKPSQLRRSTYPLECLYIHLQTQDPTFKAILDALPDHAQLWSKEEAQQLFQELPSLEQDPLAIAAHVLQLIRVLQKYHTASLDRSKTQTFLHEKDMLFIEKYISEHLSEDLSLNRLASLCGMSPCYFHTVFTKAFRRTPAAVVLSWRTEKAKTELLAGQRTPAQIAELCGFSSQNYFCYVFKKKTGMTPLEYRKKIMQRQ